MEYKSLYPPFKGIVVSKAFFAFLYAKFEVVYFLLSPKKKTIVLLPPFYIILRLKCRVRNIIIEKKFGG